MIVTKPGIDDSSVGVSSNEFDGFKSRWRASVYCDVDDDDDNDDDDTTGADTTDTIGRGAGVTGTATDATGWHIGASPVTLGANPNSPPPVYGCSIDDDCGNPCPWVDTLGVDNDDAIDISSSY